MRHLCLILTLLPGPLHAACGMDGPRKVCVPGDRPRLASTAAQFLSAPALAADTLEPGDHLPDDALTVVGTDYLGLPPAKEGWAYFRVGPEIFRADFDTRRIIERVSP